MPGYQGLIDKLYRQRERLQAELDWHESLNSFTDEGADDGTETELRDKIRDVQREIASIEHRLPSKH